MAQRKEVHYRTAGPSRRSASSRTSPSQTENATPYRDVSRYQASQRYTTPQSKAQPLPFAKTALAILIALAVLVLGVFAFIAWNDNRSITLTVNGQETTIEGSQRSISGLISSGVAPVTPGNYLAIDGSILTQGGGTAFTAQVNGQDTQDAEARLNEGDVVTLSNGVDVTEGYTDSELMPLSYSVVNEGTGAVHVYSGEGIDGQKHDRTGNDSGIVQEIVTQEPVNRTVKHYNVDTGGDKVIALTFDDGPHDDSTAEILDILKENGAKATFFTVGTQIEGREDLINRMFSEGHEVATHTYDHADGTGQGVSLILMSDEERKQEVEKGMQAIRNVGAGEPSSVFRAPGGNFDDAVATSVDGLVTAEIGWNIDTCDWQRPGASSIASAIEGATGGDIILMHDGGGDRSQTVEALRQALPKLKDEGYSFVTVSELLEKYPVE